MLRKLKILFGAIGAICTLLIAHKAFAQTVPTFPACANPQGVVKVNYATGTHGIVGNLNEFSGSDAVYTLTDQTLTQCFCTVDGNGTQTNWWKVSSLTQDEINSLLAQGWTLVTNGANWGLEEAPYLAQNSDYSCLPQTVQSASSNNSNNSSGNNSNNSVNNSGSTSDVLGASTTKSASLAGQVLGLATTGNIDLIFSFLLLGCGFLLFGWALI